MKKTTIKDYLLPTYLKKYHLLFLISKNIKDINRWIFCCLVFSHALFRCILINNNFNIWRWKSKYKKDTYLNLYITEKHLTQMLVSKHFQDRHMELACSRQSSSCKNIHSSETTVIFINTKTRNNSSIPVKTTTLIFIGAWKRETLTSCLKGWWEIPLHSIEKRGGLHNS